MWTNEWVKSKCTQEHEPAPWFSHLSHPPHRTCQLGICFGLIPGSSALSNRTQPLSCWVTRKLCWLEHGRPFARLWARVFPWVTVIFLLFLLVFISPFSLSMCVTRLRSDCLVRSMSLHHEPASPPPLTHTPYQTSSAAIAKSTTDFS